MPAQIPPAILQQQANATAPGVANMTKQDAAPQVAKTRKQPGVKKRSAAQSVYPKLASNDNDGT